MSVDVQAPVAIGAVHPVNAKRPAPAVGRWGPDPIRFVWLAAAIAALVVDGKTWLDATRAGFAVPPQGADLTIYHGAASRWLSGGGFYAPAQLTGPYDVWHPVVDSAILYPPTALPLFAAFTVLPAFLWWVIPLGVIAAVVAWHRPRPLALLVIAGLALWPATVMSVLWTGNPSMWCAAGLALATTGRTWAAPFILLKPTLGPFALWGVRSRAWWIGFGLLAAVSLAFLPMWFDYATALLNAQNGSWSYQLFSVPFMLVPVIAWLGRRMGA